MRPKLLVILSLCLALVGCPSNHARQIIADPPAPPAPASQPAVVGGDVETSVETDTVQQSGQANLVAELRAQLEAAVIRADKLESEINGLKVQGDVKGVEYTSTSALPWGVAATLGMFLVVLSLTVKRLFVLIDTIVRLSHERELERLKRKV